MPSRIHYVQITPIGPLRFDSSARVNLQDAFVRKLATIMTSTEYVRFMRVNVDRLPRSWRKAIPIIYKLAEEKGIELPKLKKFRLPKHLRKNKNPIYCSRAGIA